jgi:hypothetical protein
MVDMTFVYWLSTLIADDRFLLPFYATMSAALTMLLLQAMNRHASDKKKKIYAVSYILDVCFRLLRSNLILQKHTIVPHIVATKRILKGDHKLLNEMFLADEFDILTGKSLDFDHLPEEYKVLLGCDDITLVQLFETINHLNLTEAGRENLNPFVKENLKSSHRFFKASPQEQTDLLTTYWDYLTGIEHETNRIIFFIVRIALPRLEKYINGWQFLLLPTRGVKKIIRRVREEEVEYQDLIPDNDFLEKIKSGGIQRAL